MNTSRQHGYHPYPGAGAAALAFNLLLVYAFLAPTRSVVAAIVREKELRLREGMRMLGLQVHAQMLLDAESQYALCGTSLAPWLSLVQPGSASTH